LLDALRASACKKNEQTEAEESAYRSIHTISFEDERPTNLLSDRRDIYQDSILGPCSGLRMITVRFEKQYIVKYVDHIYYIW
jgi:hypothetical protein